MSPKSGTFHGENGKSGHFPTKDYLVVLEQSSSMVPKHHPGLCTPEKHQVWSLNIALGCAHQEGSITPVHGLQAEKWVCLSSYISSGMFLSILTQMVDVQAKLVQTIVFDLLAKKNIQKVKSRVLLQTDLCHFCLSGKQHQGMNLHPSRGALTGNTQGAKGSSKKPQKRRRESERDEDEAAEEACLRPVGA